MAIDLNDPALTGNDSDASDVAPDGVASEGTPADIEEDDERPSLRVAVAVGFPVLGAATMVGGIFEGPTPRVYAAIAGILGVAIGAAASRLRRRPFLTYAIIAGGIFAAGLLMLAPYFGDILNASRLIDEATAKSSVLQPPVRFDPGWKIIIGWLMALVGFAATWIAVELRWRSLALLIPLPVAAFAGISVPEAAQVPSGIVVLVLFAIGLGLVSSEQAGGGDEENKPSVAYEIRKALKALPLIAFITAALVVLSQTDFLFPEPVYNPAEEPQKPKAQPLSDVEDRVLFEIKDSELTGPFRMGSLDFYEPEDGSWRLPPFAAAQADPVPKSGIVDEELKERQQLQATFVIRGLGGAVLPGLPNTVGVAAKGPALAYDQRSANIRLVNGAAEPGLEYTVTAAGLPSIEALNTLQFSVPKEVGEFTRIPPVPAEVQSLIDQAPKTSKWEEFDWLRTYILDNVIATGAGTPVNIPPERVADMLTGDKKGSPYEIVAAQAMVARWVGLPARIGYGFDGGERIGDILEVRPRHGASWVEVYFPGFKWLPVIGTPKQAEPDVGNQTEKRIDPTIQPSDDIQAQLFLPLIVPPKSVLAKQIGLWVLLALPILLIAGAIYTLYPAYRKMRLRGQRRRWALEHGVRARVALAYAEWRDYATDFGFCYPQDTPLMFLERFADDDEHMELAWLTTRVLWGDLRGDTRPEAAAAAEELSRSLRRRLGATQPATMRAVAVVSRLALRDPYAPDLEQADERPVRHEQRKEEHAPDVLVPA